MIAAQKHPNLLLVCIWILGLAYMSLMQTATNPTDEEGATISSGAGSVVYTGTAFAIMLASAISFFL